MRLASSEAVAAKKNRLSSSSKPQPTIGPSCPNDDVFRLGFVHNCCGTYLYIELTRQVRRLFADSFRQRLQPQLYTAGGQRHKTELGVNGRGASRCMYGTRYSTYLIRDTNINTVFA